MILHIVLYQPKPGLTISEEGDFRAILARAAGSIDSIRRVRLGRATDLGIGYEDRSQGQKFGHVAIFEFGSEDGLRAYMAHPDHAALAEQFWKHCERTMILDVEAEDPRDVNALG